MPPVPPYKRVKVFGERGSGTNFLARAVYGNFDVEMLMHADPATHPDIVALHRVRARERRQGELADRIEDYLHIATLPDRGGWKHACLTDRLFDVLKHADETLFLCIIRHPALWIRSFHQKPYGSFFEEGDDLDSFLATPWVSRLRDEAPDLLLESPAALWPLKTESYLRHAMRRVNVKILRHEDLLTDFGGVMDLLDPLVPRRRETWKVPPNHGRTWEGDTRDFWDIRDELPDDPFSVLTPAQADHVRAQVGQPLLERFGYA